MFVLEKGHSLKWFDSVLLVFGIVRMLVVLMSFIKSRDRNLVGLSSWCLTHKVVRRKELIKHLFEFESLRRQGDFIIIIIILCGLPRPNLFVFMGGWLQAVVFAALAYTPAANGISFVLRRQQSVIAPLDCIACTLVLAIICSSFQRSVVDGFIFCCQGLRLLVVTIKNHSGARLISALVRYGQFYVIVTWNEL